MSSGIGERSTTRSSLVFWAIAGLFVVVLTVVYLASQPLLLAFGGILFGTALRGLAEFLSRKLGLSPRWSLAACVIVLIVLAVAATFWMLPSVSAQTAQLSDRLGHAYEAFRQRAEAWSGGKQLLDEWQRVQEQLGSLAMRAAGVMTSVVGGVGALVFVVFVALYIAASPEAYRCGVIRLVPRAQRGQAAALLTTLATTLRRWLLGRLVSMTAVGLTTSLGLWALGMPLPASLGLIAGVFGFVPNLGPLLSAIPAMLVAFAIDPVDASYVAVLYLVINLADGYVLTPFLQKQAVSTPPALILLGQVVLGALWGVLGVMFATPILACLLVLIRKLYVEGVLEVDASLTAVDLPARSDRPAVANRAPP